MFELNKRKSTSSRRLIIISIVLTIAPLQILSTSNDIEVNNLALHNALLRVRRQQTNSSGPLDVANSPQDLSSQDDKAAEEILTNFRCDFGTSDSPDLCKFKILDSSSGSKGVNSWSLGSGRLALYQGGPLIDASERNDTTGGYIYYETSNPYAATSNLSSNTPQQTTSYNHLTFDASRNYQPPGIQGSLGNDYSTISTSAFIKSTHHRNEASPTNDNSQGRLLNGPMNSPGPSFVSPNLTAPGPPGMCLSFKYAIQGLSAEELRLYVNDLKTERSRQIWVSSESAESNWTKGEVLYSVTNTHSITFSASSPTSSVKEMQHRKFRGYIALDDIEISKHDPSGSEGSCRGHCNFDGDLCGWTNAENMQEDDFDWSFGRGSDNLFTGPSRDFVSSANNELTGSYLFTDSGYPRRPGDKAILISPVFQPTPVNDATCMRFAVHMFGSGIGSLAIKIRYTEDAGPVQPINPGSQPGTAAQPLAPTRPDGKVNNDLVIWEMSGDAGNSWHQAQTSVSSSKSPFQVIIEGTIGENHLGNIALDEISFSSGPCPTSPPIASKNYGDCTFEQSMCYWRNPDADIHLDDLDWIRSADEQSIHGPNFDHTSKKKSGSYLKLENTFREPKSGTRAFLLSPIFQPKSSVQCISFYYYMFMRSISSSGPNLGTIRVYLASNNELVPIWRLTNPISAPNWKHARASLSTAIIDGQPQAPSKLFQIAFEGIWGDASGGAIALDDVTIFDGACDIMPAEARSVPGECTFDVDLCSWTNKTTDLMSANDSVDTDKSPFLQSVNSASGNVNARLMSTQSKRMNWQLATVDSRPVNLQDHTYKAPIGYTYVDVLDSSAQRMPFPLQSAEATVQSGTQVVRCLSFWFAAFGRQENNLLSVYLTQASAPPSPPEEAAPAPTAARGSTVNPSSNQQTAGSSSSGSPTSTGVNLVSTSSPPESRSEAEGEIANAWKTIDGKLLWNISNRNVTETNKRKWLYGQVALKADSNYIIRFIAYSNDGGFALDDVSYYDGSCETRPSFAKVQSDDEPEQSSQAPPKSTS